MKKEILNDIEDIQNRNKTFKIMQNFVKKTGIWEFMSQK